MILARGQRDKLSKYIDLASPITIHMSITGSAVYDFCCFGVDASDKLSDDRYMIFYNQTSSPNNEITYTPENNAAKFNVNLSTLPASINKLIFTVSIDGDDIMGNISNHSFQLSQNDALALSMELNGSDFANEKAIICVELYLKDEWRINAVAKGFNGGLSALLAAYGGTEAAEPPQQAQAVPSMQTQTIPSTQTQTIPSMQTQNAPSVQAQTVAPTQAQTVSSPQTYSAPVAASGGVCLKKTEEQLTNELMSKISLTKDKVNLEQHVVNLSKTVVNLSKKSGVDLGSTRAKVAVVLDYSGSMSSLYRKGIVQKTINKLVPLGLTFDDNGSINVYLFQNDYLKKADLDLSNYESYVKNVVERSGYSMGGTCYAPVLKAIIEGDVQSRGSFLGFGAQQETILPLVDDGYPTFILFITDGDNADKSASDKIIRKSSEMNVFVQFIGIGNERFSYLKKLDNLSGRARDNTGFSAMRDLNKVTDEELYTKVLEQFSLWLYGMQ